MKIINEKSIRISKNKEIQTKKRKMMKWMRPIISGSYLRK